MAQTTVEETFVPAASSNIASFTYDPSIENLTVEFVSGDEYIYFNVPQAIYSGWTAGGGSGSYFYRHIRNRFPYEKQ